MSKDNNEIAVQPRSEFGKNVARRARKAGLVPAVIYGKGTDCKSVYLNAGEWSSIARFNHHLLYLVEGESKHPVLVKEIQMNHLKNYYSHVDFQAVDAEEVIHTSIAVHAFGESIGATHGGIFDQNIHEVAVSCKLKDYVEAIKVDVSALDIGDKLHVKDLGLPADITVADPEAVVFSVMRQSAAEPEPVAPVADAAAADAAAPAAKSAPAAKAAKK